MSSNLFKHIKDDLLIDIKGRNAYFYPEFKIISTFEFFARLYKEKILNKKGKINKLKLDSPILQGIVGKNVLEKFLINKTPFSIYYIKNLLLPENLFKFKTMYYERKNSDKIKNLLNKEWRVREKEKIARNMVYAKNILKLEENENNQVALNSLSIENKNNIFNNVKGSASIIKPSILLIEKAIMNIIKNKLIFRNIKRI